MPSWIVVIFHAMHRTTKSPQSRTKHALISHASTATGDPGGLACEHTLLWSECFKGHVPTRYPGAALAEVLRELPAEKIWMPSGIVVIFHAQDHQKSPIQEKARSDVAWFNRNRNARDPGGLASHHTQLWSQWFKGHADWWLFSSGVGRLQSDGVARSLSLRES